MSGFAAPKVLSAFDPGWKSGESSTWLWFEYPDPGVLFGDSVALRGRGNEILKFRAIEGVGEAAERSKLDLDHIGDLPLIMQSGKLCGE